MLDDNLEKSFPGVPVMRLDLEGETKESHWAAEKQRALTMQVLAAATELEKLGVKTVHITLAAANSLVFEIGRKWDRRNIPQGIVYQFERCSDSPFAWGLEVPTPGSDVVLVRKPQPSA